MENTWTYFYNEKGDYTIAEGTPDEPGNLLFYVKHQDHAFRIVTAVNNHSKLVEALTELMRFEASLRHVMEKGLQYPDNFLQAVDNAKELLESIKQS